MLNLVLRTREWYASQACYDAQAMGENIACLPLDSSLQNLMSGLGAPGFIPGTLQNLIT